MFYIEKNNEIILFDTDKNRLKNTLLFKPELKDIEIKEVEEGYTIIDFELMVVEEAEIRKTNEEKQQRNQEIDTKIQELQIMCLPEILNGNTENISLYNEVIAGLEKAKL